MSSSLPKPLSLELFDPKKPIAQVQVSKCRPLVVNRQEPVDEMSSPLLRSNLQNCVEKRMSNETVTDNCDHVIEEEVTNRVRLKLLQQSPSAFEGKARAWPDLRVGEIHVMQQK